ncbi:hypothetical protein [Paludisphaera borealis]|nr:hypothetical protein [Paludisphaera borealis]
MHLRFLRTVMNGRAVMYEAGQIADVVGPAANEFIRLGMAVDHAEPAVREAVAVAPNQARKAACRVR